MTSDGPLDPSALTTGAVAAMVGATIIGREDLPLTGLAGIDQAGPGALTFIRSREYAAKWATSRATAALVSTGLEPMGHDPSSRSLLMVPDADAALLRLLERLTPRVTHQAGVHATAVVDPTASVEGAWIGPWCTVGAGAMVGAGSALAANVSLGAKVRVGAGCVLHQGVVVQDRCIIGDRCLVHPGVVIGADGFGYLPSPRGHMKIPHIGIVRIESDVEIGANTCIDRAKFGETIVGQGTKIDNLVQIGHNCRIGRHCIICGQVGLAGSVEVGDGTVIGGQVGVADNRRIGAGVMIGAQSGVMVDLADGAKVFGYPAGPASAMLRNYALLQHLAEHIARIKTLEKRVGTLESSAAAPHP